MDTAITEADRRQKLALWLQQRQALSTPKRPLKFYRLSIEMNGREGPSVEVFEVEKDCDVGGLSADIYSRAHEDAAGRGGGVHHYFVIPYFGKETQPGSRFAIYVRAGSESDVEGDRPMGTIRGAADAAALDFSREVIGQSYRHMERKSALLEASTAALFQNLMRHNERLAAELEGSTERQMEFMRLTAEMTQERNRFDAEVRQAEAATQSRGMLFNTVANLLPVVATKLTGVPLAGGQQAGDADAQLGLVKQLMGGLAPDQVATLQSILRPDQQLLIMQLMQSSQEAEARKAQASQMQNASNLMQIAPTPDTVGKSG